MKIIQQLLISIVFCLSISKTVSAEWDEWLADAEISFSAEDNINHAINDALSESDLLWNGFASVGRFYHFSGFTRLNISAYVEGKVHHKFSKLNQINSGLKLAIRHKFGLGLYQPWIKVSVSSDYIFSKSTIREGYQTHAGIELGKLLHERIDMVFSYSFDYRNSRNSNAISTQKLNVAGFDFTQQQSTSVYDISGHSIGLQINGAITEQILLTLGYSYRDGDIVSTSIPANSSVYQSVIDAIVNDDALPGWAYRADGITHSYSADASYAFLKGDASINFGYQHTEANADSFTYRNNLFRINFVYFF
jgi:hypothetical protein